MPGAQPRRTVETRLGATVLRGFYSAAPGAYRVRRQAIGVPLDTPGPIGGGGGPGDGDWLPSLTVGGGWVWDGGLYQQATYEAMSGFPASLPSGAEEFWYFVVEAGADLDDDPGGIGSTGNRARYGWDSGGYHELIDSGPTPGAGAHIWLVWYGPNYDPDIDPQPSPAPSSLVSATLAEFGTG
jgi:hypothetical protein